MTVYVSRIKHVTDDLFRVVCLCGYYGRASADIDELERELAAHKIVCGRKETP